MSDIAKRAGVSKNTVSLALRRDPQISAATRRRIEGIARRLGYRKNATVARLMAEMRRSRDPGFQSCLALVNANTDRLAFRNHPTIPEYVRGCTSRAEQLGYRWDEFWLHDPGLDGARLNKILRARGIEGVIVVGLMRENRLPVRFLPTWESFATVVTGVRTHGPALSFACTDHHMLGLKAFENALDLGYRRPGLVLDPVIDRLVDGRFTAGAQTAQRGVPAARRLRPCHPPAAADGGRAAFRSWLRKEQPDVILTLYNTVRHWLEDEGWKVPEQIGLIQLEWRAASPDWAGMNQHNDVVGQAAVEMVVSMIHNRESGVPSFPRATMVGPTWVSGRTVVAG